MKTVLTAIVGIALSALLFSVPMVGAAGGNGTGPDGKGCRMMKADGTPPCNGKMMQKNCCRGMGQGQGYIDANGDGVCDHYAKAMADGGKCPGCGMGQGKGKGRMMNNGQGNGYVDADGNGVCDHHPDNAKTPKTTK